jgi:hypothetical protein
MAMPVNSGGTYSMTSVSPRAKLSQRGCGSSVISI